jgi:hypothetical protein
MFEARAKILWGDPPAQVLGYLRGQGFDQEEAQAMVQELNAERTAEVRANGIKYLCGGIALIAVPIVALMLFLRVGYIYVRTFLFTLVIGAVGVFLAIKGAMMLLSPKSEGGNVAEQ